jgi:hypothetical protein
MRCRKPVNNLIMNLGRSWRESWVCGEGRVDRAGSMTSLKDKSSRRMLPGRSPCEVPVAGTFDRERSQGGVSLWDEAPGWEVL